MIEKNVIISNRAGIHARPAALIAQTANKFKADISLEKDGVRINAKSIMGIITMAAAYQTPIVIIAEGSDDQEAADAIESLFIKKFEEE